MAIDLNRTSGSLNLPAKDSGEIFASVSKASAFQQAARQIVLPGTGSVVHTIGKATASIVGETDIKPVSAPALASKTVQAHTFSVIIPVSNQLISDASALVAAVREQAPLAIAEKFDATITGEGTAPANFADLSTADVAPVTSYATFVAALGGVAANGGKPTAAVMSTALFYNLAAVVNDFGVPVFSITDTTINGLPYYLYNGSVAEGYIGDFSRAVWGSVEGVSVAVSDSATLTGVGNLFERNMTAVRVEARLGFQVADIADFVKVTPGV